MRRALQRARQAARLGEVPVGAVVTRDGIEVSWGFNLREHHQDPSAHAEFIAMRRAAAALGSWRLDGCVVYVTLEPCPMCAGLMVQSRISRCVYGATDPKGGYCGTLHDLSNIPELNHAFDVRSGVHAEASSDLLRDFFRALRRR